MPNQPNTSKSLISAAVEKYSESSGLRAAIQLIPYIGGSLDTLIGGEGQKIQQRRLAHFIDELDMRLTTLEAPQHVLAEEELFDLMMLTFGQVVKTRSEAKRKRFAQIIANEIAQAGEAQDAETAIRLIGGLEDLHIQILDVVLRSSREFVTISKPVPFPEDASHTYPILAKTFSNIPEHILRLSCSELVAKGLLLDEGVGRISSRAMEQFAATDLAKWLFTWLEGTDSQLR